MHVLLTETVTPRARDAARSLEDAGHAVHRCHDAGDDDATCVGLRGGTCPLEAEPIDLVVSVRPVGAPKPTPLEDGVRCGIRRKVPVLVAGAITGDPWTRWEHLAWPGTDLAVPVSRAADTPLAEHSWAATRTLRRSLLAAGLPFDATARVVRRDGYLKVGVESGSDVPRAAVQRAAVRICQALRAIDPWARGIDVSIRGGGPR